MIGILAIFFGPFAIIFPRFAIASICMAFVFCAGALMAGYFVPGLNRVLSFQELNSDAWLMVIFASLLPLVTNQAMKKIWKF